MRSEAVGAVLALLLTGCHEETPRTDSYTPPDFAGLVWVDGAPDLRGKVALVRWWTNG
jgi:hypothetical protein